MISVWEGKGMMYLTVSEVSKTYANETVATLALNNLSMQVEKGEFVAIVGHSGSGKTTLFNMVAGLDNADKGHIFFDGVDLTTLDEDARAAYRLNKIGIIYQFFNLLPMLNGCDNISLPCRLAGRFIDDKKKMCIRDRCTITLNQLNKVITPHAQAWIERVNDACSPILSMGEMKYILTGCLLYTSRCV